MLKCVLMESAKKGFGKRWKPLICVVLCMSALLLSAQSKAADSSCKDLKMVVEHSVNNFKDHRTAAKYFNKVTIWDTDITLAGQECQIWQWGGGNYSYVCTRNFPLQQAGVNFNREAINTIKGCFKEDLKVVQDAFPVKDGYHTQIVTKDDKRRIDLFLVNNSGLFRDSWTFYFMATGANGFPLSSLQDGLKSSD